MKILLSGPFKNGKLRVGQYFSPPLGIYRIKSFIEKKTCCTVDVVDIDLKGKEYFFSTLKRNKYDIIGFSILQPTFKNDIKMIYEAKKLSPHSLIIAGGQGAVFNHRLILDKTPVSAVVKGFGEFALLGIINNPGRLKETKGLYIKENNRIIDTCREPYDYEEFREISLSFDFKKVPYEEYWKQMEKFYTKRHLQIMKNEDFLYTIRVMTSSHCPRKCVFCSSTNFLDNLNCKAQQRIALNAEDIYSLVKNALKSHPKCRAIYFNDDDFLFDKERIRKLCLLLKNIHGISYFCLSRIDNADENLLRLMKNAGFKLIIYGVESFSNKVLKDMHKNICIKSPEETIKDTIKKTIEAGITPLMNLILFFPTTRTIDITKTIENTVELVEYGARLTVYPYIEAYRGSDILEQNLLNLTYDRFQIERNKFRLPRLILPFSDKIKSLASESLKLRERLVDKFLKKYSWKGAVPHPLHSLALFLAAYQLLGIDTPRIEHLIGKIMMEEAKRAALDEKIKAEAVR